LDKNTNRKAELRSGKMANTIMATLAESFTSERIDMQTGEILDA
jgi:hypothetical protein